MTTHPGECERSAESCGAGVCAAAGNREHASRAKPTTETRRHGEKSGMWSTAALGCGLVDCQLVSCFGLNDHVMENDFDLLMENASHSDESIGDTNLRSRWGTTALAANRSQKARFNSWARLSGLRPTGGR